MNSSNPREKKPSPVRAATTKFNELLAGLDPAVVRLPSERHLSRVWGISQAAVNRAAQQLIAAGLLRRSGYRLFRGEASPTSTNIAVAVLTHRSHRYPFLETISASLGIETREFFYVGRDNLRALLRRVLDEGFDAVVMRMTDGGWEWDDEAAEFAVRRIPLIIGEPAPQAYPMVTEDWAGAGAMAVEKLVSAGHTGLVFLGSLRRPHRSNVVERGYVETCLRLGLGDSAARMLRFTSHYADNISSAIAPIRTMDPRPTGCVLYDVDHVPSVTSALAHAGLRIPADISLVAVGDHQAALNQNPPVTCAGFNTKALTRLILAEVVLLVEESRSVAPILSIPRLKLEPIWRERGSVLRRAEVPAAPDLDALVKNTTSKNWSPDLQERRREVEQLARQPHERAEGVPREEFFPVQLEGFANRSISRQNSWLGHAPLLHFTAGERRIHGVPFEIIQEKDNAGKSALVLQPQHPEACNVTIPIDRHARAVYFLHGCGFVGQAIPFGWYDFVLQGGKTFSVPLVARGMGAALHNTHKPNIQDWWNDFPQIEGPGFKHFVVTDGEDPFAYERYLYTLEWQNPTPSNRIREIRISVNPALRTVLGILGITLLDEAPAASGAVSASNRAGDKKKGRQ